MIVDLITNSKKIIDFVKEKEGFGGRIEEKDGEYKLLNVQIGYAKDFNNDLKVHMGTAGIKKREYFYKIFDSRGKMIDW